MDKVEVRTQRTGGTLRKSSGYVYRISATLPASLETVAAFLRDVNNMGSWNRTCQVSGANLNNSSDPVVLHLLCGEKNVKSW